MVGKRERMARPSGAPSKEGLRSQSKLVVDDTGNLHRLARKLSGGKPCFESCLHCRVAKHWWTTRRIRRNHLAAFVQDYLDNDRALRPHSSRSLWIGWRRQSDRSAVENATRDWLEYRAWSRSRRRFIDDYERNLGVRTHNRSFEIDRTRGWNHAVDERSEDATGASEDFGDMEGVSAGAAKRHIGGDVDVVCRDPGAAGRTSDLHEIGGIMP